MKLVRDKIPNIAPNREFRKATPEEIKSLLLAKVQEEALEVATATSRDEYVEEMADLYTVMLRLASELGVDWAEVRAKAESKNEEKGAFEECWILVR